MPDTRARSGSVLALHRPGYNHSLKPVVKRGFSFLHSFKRMCVRSFFPPAPICLFRNKLSIPKTNDCNPIVYHRISMTGEGAGVPGRKPIFHTRHKGERPHHDSCDFG